MVRKKDQFWEYVETVNGGRSCKFCKQLFSGETSISRIKSHLARVNRRDVKLCSKVPEDVQSRAFEAIEIDALKKKATSTKSLDNVEETAIVSRPSSSHQPNMPSICHNDFEDKSAVDVKLAKFILSNDISLDVIQSPSFIDFLRSVTNFGPSYELPSHSSFITKLVSMKLEEKISKYVTSVKNSFAKTGGTLMCIMDVDEIYRYVHIFACTPRGMVVIDSLKASKDENVDEKWFLSLAIETVGPKHVTQLLSLGCQEYLIKDHHHQRIISTCVFYQIRDLLLDINCDIQWVVDIISLAKTIVGYINYHNINLSVRRECIRSKKLLDRFLHTEIVKEFLMVHFILQAENELQAMQFPISCSSCTSCDSSSEDKVTQHAEYVQDLNCIIHNNDFWRGVREVVQVLQPIFVVFHLVDNYMSTSGYLYEAWERAIAKIKECMNKNQKKYEPIWQKFKANKFDLIPPIYKAAAFLNPAYMLSKNFKVDIEIEKVIDYVVETLVALEDKEAFVEQIQHYPNKVACTFTPDEARTTHPRKYWEYYGGHLPMLQKYAIRILSQPCSMLSCDQYTWGLRVSDNPILHVNERLMEKYSILGAQEEEPINLDNLSDFLAHAHNDLDIKEYIDRDWRDMTSDLYDDGIMDRWK